MEMDKRVGRRCVCFHLCE